MADVETQTRLQVANLAPADSGRGIARLPLGLMKELGLDEGDVIEIVGKRTTGARAVPRATVPPSALAWSSSMGRRKS